MLSALVAALVTTAQPEAVEPSPQSLVFYNARLALKDRQPNEALKLWLLRNVLRQQTQKATTDAEFRSVVWAALGELGLCPDGFPRDDEGGAQLWPVALHNWVLLSTARGQPAAQPNPFEAFEASRQQRFISLHDVLDTSELQSVSFFPSDCAQPNRSLDEFGLPPAGNLNDRMQMGYVLQTLLRHARRTLVPEKVAGMPVIEVRLFDLDLELAQLEAANARQRAALAEQKALTKGVSRLAVPAVRAEAEKWAPDSAQAAFLRRAMTWAVDDWLALSRERRLALFARARPFVSTEESDRLALSLIDALTAQAQGAEVEAWVSLMNTDPTRRLAIVDGERGKRLLALDVTSGFHERGPIALHRGVMLLESGDQREALRSFAAAMMTANDSRASSVTLSLARRWLSYVLGSYETNDELIATLKALIPAIEYNVVIEELIWKAALRADARSFERLVATTRKGGAFDARATRLRPLSQGKAGELIDELVRSAAEEPHAMLRFVNVLLEHLETEELNIRQSMLPLLKLLNKALDTLSTQPNLSKAQLRRAEELGQRVQAILTGLGQLVDSALGKARGLSPNQPAFAGNVRLAPVDVLPWPFPPLEPNAPSPFRPLVLRPVEWEAPQGQLIFGWRISE